MRALKIGIILLFFSTRRIYQKRLLDWRSEADLIPFTCILTTSLWICLLIEFFFGFKFIFNFIKSDIPASATLTLISLPFCLLIYSTLLRTIRKSNFTTKRIAFRLLGNTNRKIIILIFVCYNIFSMAFSIFLMAKINNG
jgi:hypothetical protein